MKTILTLAAVLIFLLIPAWIMAVGWLLVYGDGMTAGLLFLAGVVGAPILTGAYRFLEEALEERDEG